MGVRFECPSGHKLNVKVELVGKRGICPECGVRFIVPAFSGERVSAVDPTATTPATSAAPGPPPSQVEARGVTEPAPGAPSAAAATSATAHQISPRAGASSSTRIAVEPPLSQPSTGSQNGPAAEPTTWYVRPVAGGQYGPASTEVFRQWIAEGRVPADCWVWCTGWPEWKPGVEAVALFPVAPGAPLAAVVPPVAAPSVEHPERFAPAANVAAAPVVLAADSHHESTRAEARRAEIKRRKRRVQTISVVLGVLALAMAAVLLIVLSQ